MPCRHRSGRPAHSDSHIVLPLATGYKTAISDADNIIEAVFDDLTRQARVMA